MSAGVARGTERDEVLPRNRRQRPEAFRKTANLFMGHLFSFIRDTDFTKVKGPSAITSAASISVGVGHDHEVLLILDSSIVATDDVAICKSLRHLIPYRKSLPQTNDGLHRPLF
jgi:hypothetical protein